MEKPQKLKVVRALPQIRLITLHSSEESRRLWLALANHFTPRKYCIFQQCINSDGDGTYEVGLEGKVPQTALREIQAYIAGWKHGYNY